MSDWQRHVVTLSMGETVTFRPRGKSMAGRVEDGELVTIEPIDHSQVVVGDVVLCKVSGRFYLHLVKAIDRDRFLIGNNKGSVNGWTRLVYGRLAS